MQKVKGKDMEDKDLNTLKDLKIPEPSESAKEQAFMAAMEAFDEPVQKKQENTQGVPNSLRLISSFIINIWEWIMNRQMMIGSAAAVVLLAPVAMGAYFHFNEQSNNAVTDTTTRVVEEKVKAESLKTADTLKKENDETQVANKIVAAKPKEQPLAQKSKPKTVAKVTKKNDSSGKGLIYDRLASAPKKSNNRARVGYAQKPMAIPNTGRRIQSQGFGTGGNFIGHTRPHELIINPPADKNRDRFAEFESNELKAVKENPVSTFSVDVDTSSYAFVRKMLNQGRLPRKDAVRVEELINYFNYDYQGPEGKEQPFKANVAVYQTPWNKDTKLLHIGIKGYDIVPDNKPQSNLVFLIDVSGSMRARDKLPLLKSAFKLLVGQLNENDHVSIVTYAGRSATVLEPTKANEKAKIIAALDQLQSGGSTAGQQGIQQAYALAQQHFNKEGVNRVILATDGDFNVGISDRKQLKTFIEEKRKSGVFLSILGFGQGNYNDALMQTLAQNGNGVAAYIDTLREAQKVLVEEASSSLFPIAKDVKIQIEFNPNQVAEYRLIGYETRKLKRQDFNNDKVDAGDIGSGHTVTAIYEITPVDSKARKIDDLRYAEKKKTTQTEKTDEYAFLKLRYKLPKEDKSKLVTIPVTKEAEALLKAQSNDIRFAASVAAFGQKLRNGKYLNDFTYDNIRELATNAKGKDKYGYRSEFIGLVGLAESLSKVGKSNKPVMTTPKK